MRRASIKGLSKFRNNSAIHVDWPLAKVQYKLSSWWKRNGEHEPPAAREELKRLWKQWIESTHKDGLVAAPVQTKASAAPAARLSTGCRRDKWPPHRTHHSDSYLCSLYAINGLNWNSVLSLECSIAQTTTDCWTWLPTLLRYCTLLPFTGWSWTFKLLLVTALILHVSTHYCSQKFITSSVPTSCHDHGCMTQWFLLITTSHGVITACHYVVMGSSPRTFVCYYGSSHLLLLVSSSVTNHY